MTFSKLGITTTYQELREFRRIIYDEVKAWVYNAEGKENGWARYISQTKKPYKTGATDSTKLDFDLVFSVWQAAVIHEDNSDITFEDLASLKLFNRKSKWDRKLREGKGFGAHTVRNILITVKQWIQVQSDLNPNSFKLK